MIEVGDEKKTGQIKVSDTGISLRQKGIRQGAMLMLLSVILIPAYILLAALFPANDRLVESAVSDTPFEKISQAILLTLFMLGLARVLYARFFQAGEGAPVDHESEITQLRGSPLNQALPPVQGVPVSGFGSWRVTGEIVPSASADRTDQQRVSRPLDGPG